MKENINSTEEHSTKSNMRQWKGTEKNEGRVDMVAPEFQI